MPRRSPLFQPFEVFSHMAVSAVYGFTITTTETLADAGLNTNNKSVKHDAYDESGTLTAVSSVPATQIAEFLLTLSGGAGTIDLRNLTGTNGAVIDGNGLKVQLIRIKNLGANVMTFAEGASNGYALGSTYAVKANGGIAMEFGNDSMPDIGGSDKTIDVSGTGSQTAEVTIIMG